MSLGGGGGPGGFAPPTATTTSAVERTATIARTDFLIPEPPGAAAEEDSPAMPRCQPTLTRLLHADERFLNNEKSGRRHGTSGHGDGARARPARPSTSLAPQRRAGVE